MWFLEHGGTRRGGVPFPDECDFHAKYNWFQLLDGALRSHSYGSVKKSLSGKDARNIERVVERSFVRRSVVESVLEAINEAIAPDEREVQDEMEAPWVDYEMGEYGEEWKGLAEREKPDPFSIKGRMEEVRGKESEPPRPMPLSIKVTNSIIAARLATQSDMVRIIRDLMGGKKRTYVVDGTSTLERKTVIEHEILDYVSSRVGDYIEAMQKRRSKEEERLA